MTSPLLPPEAHRGVRWHWLRFKDHEPSVCRWHPGGSLPDIKADCWDVGEGPWNAAAVYEAGWRYHAPCAGPDVAAELEALRAVERAASRLIKEGLQLRRGGLTVIERKDKSDPHWELCEALTAYWAQREGEKSGG